MSCTAPISVAICSYNRETLILECLTSIFSQQHPRLTVHLVDNASTDNTVKTVRQRFGDQVNIHLNKINTGGSGGFNRAISLAMKDESEYILLLDSDCVLGEGAIAKMCQYLDTNLDVAMVGPKVYWPSPKGLVQELGANLDWEKAEFVPRYRNYDENINGKLIREDDVDYLAACCLMARCTSIESAGNIDPNYFIYFDDIEWNQRIKSSGGKIRAITSCHAFHHSGGATKATHFTTYYFWRNRVNFFLQYCQKSQRNRTKQHLLDDCARAIATSRTLKQVNAAAIIERAVIDGIDAKLGPFNFDQLDINLDAPSPFLRKNTESATRVDHIFESEINPETSVITDRYGKYIDSKTALSLRPDFRENLKITKNKLAKIFSRIK